MAEHAQDRKALPKGGPSISPELAAMLRTAAEVLQAVQLASVRYTHWAAHAFRNIESLPEEAMIEPVMGFTKPKCRIEDHRISIETSFVFSMQGELPSGHLERYVALRLGTRLDYILNPKEREFTLEEVETFARRYTAFHAWGYWREYVQSSLPRMDLPSFTLPMLFIDAAEQLSLDDAQADAVIAAPVVSSEPIPTARKAPSK